MTQEQRIRLPLNPDDYAAALPPQALMQLRAINDAFNNSRTELKQLELEKGIHSRQIGTAKKAGEPIETLLARVQQASENIRAIKERQDRLQVDAAALLETPAAMPTASATAAHFGPDTTATNDTTAGSAAHFEIVTADETLAEQWNAFVTAQPHSCVYHRYEFRRIIAAAFGHEALYLAALDPDRRICGILPAIRINSRIFGHYIVSVPFFNYGGALAEHPTIEQALMQQLDTQAQALGVSHIEYRDTRPRPGYAQKTEKASLLLKLPAQADSLWQDIGTKVRAQIKKAQASELRFVTGKHELLDDFYRVFTINMRDLGTPVYSKDFFRIILDTASLDTCLALVYRQNRPVSCGFMIRWNDTMEIPWASTLREANAYNANMFLYWNVLQTAITSGADFFDFGRSSQDAGTFKFKLQWGAQPQPLYWHYWLPGQGQLPQLNPHNPKYQLAIAIWRKLPVWLTRLIGPHLVKNLP